MYNLLQWEGEISLRIWLVLQGEVPPLGVERFEAMTHHSATQNHAVFKLLLGYLAW